MDQLADANGLHRCLQDDKTLTVLVKRKVGELEAELMRLHRVLGHGSVSITCDMQTGKILNTRCSSTELSQVGEEIKTRAAAPNSEFLKAAEMFSGKISSGGAPRQPFPFPEQGVEEENSDKAQRSKGRRDTLLAEVFLCKSLYGGIKFKHTGNKKGAKGKEVDGILDHQHATIEQCEQYLRLYYERGHDLSPSILRYLNSYTAVSTRPWVVPLARKDEFSQLETLKPLFFDPVNPSTIAKFLWKLKKEKGSDTVSIKRDENDKRKTEEARARGGQLKLKNQ